ncbi:HAD family hydrolase [Gordonia desulfuricans]|uniref:HAD family hydrolase n=1 Tax=Gordonia desulfuricans TaxID=89051 RepID=UPI00073EE90B|nr:HAD-IB family hydrolase [Gordonia desulfuricans]
MSDGRPHHTPGSRAAAFFDLDKTVITRSSALAFVPHFYSAGLLNRRTLVRSVYGNVGLGIEHEQSRVERLRRSITSMCRGWDVDEVGRIVAETLQDVVTPLIYAEAEDLIANHRHAGRDVVLVSASGMEFAAPIGAMLGVDHIRATEMTIADGHYTGEIEFYCYGERKAEAVRGLAAEHGYDLAASFAFSDSITDLPMLTAVGHPVAVNPDHRLRRHAEEYGWPILDFTPTAPQRRRHTDAGPAITAATVAGAVGAGVLAGCALGWCLRSRQPDGRPADTPRTDPQNRCAPA